MRIKQDVRQIKWQGRTFMLSEDANEKMPPLALNETADRILQMLASDISRETLLLALAEEYDVGEATLAADLDHFIEQLRDMELLEE